MTRKVSAKGLRKVILQDADALRALLELGRRLSTRPSLDALFGEIVVSVVDVLPGAEAASLWLTADSGDTLYPVAWHGHEDAAMRSLRMATDTSMVGKALASEVPITVDDTRADSNFMEIGTSLDGVQSLIGVRLAREDQILGLLFADSYTATAAFGPSTAEFLQAVADVASVALENALLVERLRGIPAMIYRAEEAERRRLAYEVHDHIGSSLTAAHLGLSAHLETHPDPQLEHSRLILAELVDSVRGLSLDLRPAALDAFGLQAALTGHLERFAESTGLEVIRQFSIPEAPRLPDEVASAAFRFIQEGLVNAARHSEAKSVIVTANQQPHELHVAVEDDGVGLKPRTPSSGIGMEGMRERISSVQGILAIWSEPGKGLKIEARIPIGPRASS
jgi:signal transduction histidine kinase